MIDAYARHGSEVEVPEGRIQIVEFHGPRHSEPVVILYFNGELIP